MIYGMLHCRLISVNFNLPVERKKAKLTWWGRKYTVKPKSMHPNSTLVNIFQIGRKV